MGVPSPCSLTQARPTHRWEKSQKAELAAAKEQVRNACKATRAPLTLELNELRGELRSARVEAGETRVLLEGHITDLQKQLRHALSAARKGGEAVEKEQQMAAEAEKEMAAELQRATDGACGARCARSSRGGSASRWSAPG